MIAPLAESAPAGGVERPGRCVRKLWPLPDETASAFGAVKSAMGLLVEAKLFFNVRAGKRTGPGGEINMQEQGFHCCRQGAVRTAQQVEQVQFLALPLQNLRADGQGLPGVQFAQIPDMGFNSEVAFPPRRCSWRLPRSVP